MTNSEIQRALQLLTDLLGQCKLYEANRNSFEEIEGKFNELKDLVKEENNVT